MQRTLLPLPFLLLALPLASQTSLSYLEGTSPTDLRLLTLDESDPTAPPRVVLSGIEVLATDLTNRTVHHQLRADHPHLDVDQGVPRIRLAHNGQLLHYRVVGTPRWGFVWIGAAAPPRVLLELTDPSEDPFEDRVGVAPDGRHVALVTEEKELYLARLDGQVYGSTGTPVRQVPTAGEVETVSVCVGPTHVFFQTGEDYRLWRCSLADLAVPEDVTPPGAADELEELMAPSGDGRAVVFLAGESDDQDIWMLTGTGPAVRLAPPSSEFHKPRYLPDESDGPLLLLNDDGTRLLYVDRTGPEDEFFLLDTTGANAPTHITADQNVDPYIGIGILPAFVGQTLLIALGDDNAPNPSSSFDWYLAEAGGGVVNVTRTAVEQQPPFGWGNLAPCEAFGPVGGCLLTEERNGSGGMRLRCLDAQGGTRVMVQDLRGEPALGRAPGAPNILVPNVLGDCLLSPSLQLLLQGPPGFPLSPDSQGPIAGLSVFLVALPWGPQLAVFRVAGVGLFPTLPIPGLRQLHLTPGGGLILNDAGLHYYPPTGGSVAVSGPAAVRVLL